MSLPDLVGGQLGRHLRGGEFPGGDVDVGYAGLALAHNHAHQVVIALLGKQARLDDRPGRDDPYDVPLDQPLARLA